MTYLLDTCILSKLRKIKKYPDKKLAAWIRKHPESEYYISVMTVGEIEAGISQLKAKNASEKKKKMVLEEWFHGDLIPRFQDRILSIDFQVMTTWGKMVGEAKQKGVNYPVVDSLIAATAIQHNLILVTENVSDFDAMPVDLYDPCVS